MGSGFSPETVILKETGLGHLLTLANLPERKEATETHTGDSETEKDFLVTPSISRTLYWQAPFRNTPPPR